MAARLRPLDPGVTRRQLGFLGSTQYPLWTLTVIALNIIVIYALVVRWEGYPEERVRDRALA